MANEIQVDFPSGDTLYFIVRNSSGQVWYPTGEVFEDWGGGAGRTMDDYDLALTDKTGSRYIGSFDTNISTGRYTVQVFLQAGANPADGDDLVGAGQILWSGTSELTADKVLANKAVQTKSTGVIEYYDDDGQTVLLTHTLTDAESTITRTPS